MGSTCMAVQALRLLTLSASPITVSSHGDRSPVSRARPVLFVIGAVSMYVGAALAVGLFSRAGAGGGRGAAHAGRGGGAAGVAPPGRCGLARAPRLAAGGRVRAGHGGDEHRVLRGHRAAAAGHRGGGRVLRSGGGRGGGVAASARRRRGRAGRGRAWRSSRMSAGQGRRPGCCGRSRRPRCGRRTSCSASAWRAPGNGLDDMAVGFAVAAVVLSPAAAAPAAGRGSRRWSTRSCCCSAVGVGVLSSVVPYVLDQIVLRRVGQARFAVLLALLPATATIVGLIAAAAGARARSRRSGSRPSWGRSRCGRGTATPAEPLG